MSPSNALNDLVNAGKSDIHGFVKEYFDVFLTGCNERQRKPVQCVSALLTLALKNTPPDLDVAHIRSIIIEENLSVLSQLADADARILPLFAVATGRVTQIREYIAAAQRVGQTDANAAEDESRFLAVFQEVLALTERTSVRLGLDEQGAPILMGVQAKRAPLTQEQYCS